MTKEICATCYSFDRIESRCAYFNEDTTEQSYCACWTPKEAEE